MPTSLAGDSRQTGRPANRSGATQASLRSHNLRVVLQQVYGRRDPPSRADIAAETGMTRSTVSRLVDDLVGAGLVLELEPFVGQRGRPATPLVPSRDTVAALGLEVNVEHLAARVVDLSGRVLGEAMRLGHHAGADPEEVFGDLADLARGALKAVPRSARLVSVEVAVPGLVDGHRDLLLRAPNLGWEHVEPRALLVAAGLDLPNAHFGVGNEADYAALTVLQPAPGRPGPWTEFLYVSGEVGIGSAAVTGGRVMSGRHGWAGEIGHVCIDPTGPVCACGATGCLEGYAGRQAILRSARVADLPALHRALALGRTAATGAVATAGQALGVAVSAALNLLDLPTVILSGHLAELGEYLLPAVQAELANRVLAAPYEDVQVVTMALDPAPAARGAAYAGLAKVLEDPIALVG